MYGHFQGIEDANFCLLVSHRGSSRQRQHNYCFTGHNLSESSALPEILGALGSVYRKLASWVFRSHFLALFRISAFRDLLAAHFHEHRNLARSLDSFLLFHPFCSSQTVFYTRFSKNQCTSTLGILRIAYVDLQLIFPVK